ncbi:MAG: complex I NDUFA9 subunit family protein, partial [bacterium]
GHGMPCLCLKPMKIFLTGGAGFVGGFIVDELLKRNHEITALVHTHRKSEKFTGSKVSILQGDVLQRDTLKMDGCDTVIHLVGIIREKKNATFEKLHVDATVNVIEAAREAGIKRFIHMSALGTRENAHSRYHKTKYRAERFVVESGLTYTIFRPSVIFGQGDKFLNMLKDLYRNPYFVPVIGSGDYKLQPIYAPDVAYLFAEALVEKESENRIFEIGGPEAYTFIELLNEIGKHLCRNRAKIHIPIPVMALAAGIMERVLPNPPITTDQLIMLQEDNVCDVSPVLETFKITLTPLHEGMAEYMISG